MKRKPGLPVEHVFSESKLNGPAKWIRFIRNNIDKSKFSDYERDINEVMSSYDREIRKRGDYFYSCYVEVIKIFNNAFGNIKDLLEDVTE